jgi:uncharacterized protein YbbC (DUF1343 family)
MSSDCDHVILWAVTALCLKSLGIEGASQGLLGNNAGIEQYHSRRITMVILLGFKNSRQPADNIVEAIQILAPHVMEVKVSQMFFGGTALAHIQQLLLRLI